MKKSLAVLLFASCAALAAPDDEVFLEAREAFQRGDIVRLDRLAKQLDDNYPLALYVQYWQLRSRLADLSAGEIENFLARHNNSLAADRLRADWLRQLAKDRDWPGFLREYPQLTTEDLELVCFAYQARLALGESGILTQARPLWFTAQVLPESCLPLFELMFKKDMLTAEDSWTRIRLALEIGNLSGARMLLGYLPAGQRPDAKTLDSIARRPQHFLDRAPLPLKTRAQRELVIYALYKTAEGWPQTAADRLHRIAKDLPDTEREYAWAQIASVAARSLHPDALTWFRNAGNGMNDRQLTWRARSALRAGDWNEVFAAIEAMSPTEYKYAQWRYWKARALSALGRQSEANALLAPLSNQFNFYGQLAAEELGTSISTVPQTYRPDEDEIEATAKDPGIVRALTLYAIGLRYEGALEWQWAVKDYEDKRLLAAAELASRNEWYERTIDTAERTVLLHDFGLRYPTPYREVVQDYASQLDLDEAWVYGLVRQESRFAHTARSTAGASGLMQLMPSTARWVAKRLGLSGHHAKLTATADSNIVLGTYYLRQMMDSLDNQMVLASAGYNAGPRRAREWIAGRSLEGAVYIETIPFAETREYVKRVMNNTLYYARLLHQAGPGLRERLGTVPARMPQNN
ncbi:MAG TPA: transglycosylase SLT domain-containing protein [Burkholderiales bacterium]|nr:transglycosylase SLT domain-containing protein [Burkholderiales bacterium]